MTDSCLSVRGPFIAAVSLALVAGGCARRTPPSVPAVSARAPVASGTPGAFERNERAFAVAQRADSAYRAKTYPLAAELYARAAADSRDPGPSLYNAACALALAGRSNEAASELERSLRSGYRGAQMQRDPDLASLRGTAAWSRLSAMANDNLSAFQRAHADPARAKLVTSDIDHFWRAYDIAASRATAEERQEVYRREYFDRGSAGLFDYYVFKIHSIASFVKAIDTHPRYYASLRAGSLRVAAQVAPIRAAFRKTKALYADATFPDVYFVMGSLTSAGTVSDLGLLLGVDQSTAAPDSPREELSPTVRAWARGVDEIPPIVAHELVHFEQTRGGTFTLLRAVLTEGSADFIGSLTSGNHTNAPAHAFGNAHESDVWRRFEHDMHGTDDRDWIANGGSDRVSDTWVADLGYYVGYQIAKAYYERAADKRQAIRDLLEDRDPDEILRVSGYAARFAR